MDNIEIKRTGNKRSIESLLQQSGIDNNTFNYEAQQIRQAYTKTIRDLNQKIKDQQRSIQKLQLQINQKNQIISDQMQLIKEKQFKLGSILNQNSSLKQTGILTKKRLQQAQYKLQQIQNNRNSIPHIDQSFEQDKVNDQIYDPKNIKKQVYKEITNILSLKIAKFVKQLKSFSMSVQLQRFIESFLQEIIYINSSAKNKDIFETNNENNKNRKVGRISERRLNAAEKVTDYDEWKKMEKSLQKLKNVSGLSPKGGNKIVESKAIRKNHSGEATGGAKPSINYI